MNEIIVQASHGTGALYGVMIHAKIVFGRAKMVNGESLQVLEEKINGTDPDENEHVNSLEWRGQIE